MSNKLWLPLGIATFLSLVTRASMAQAAETFSVDNVALNTNENFEPIDGNPRMSIYPRNDNDPDQQFERLPGNSGSILLKHRSTENCLNAHYLYSGAQINVWPCDASDPDQNWTLVSVGSGRFLLKRTGTNLCVDAPTRQSEGIVYLSECNATDADQRWLSSNYDQPNGNIIIQPGTTNLDYYRGQQWITPNNYKFVFQSDGNLVLYSPQGKPLWATGTEQTTADLFAVQADGNVVLYDRGRPVWATDTAGNLGAFLAIQTDGNVVVYASNNTPLFDTGTYGGRVRTVTASADWLNKPKFSYRPNIESVLRAFFGSPANTNNENWTQKTLTDMWDRIGGESAQFQNGDFPNGDIWQVDMPSDVNGVYEDLSNIIFGYVTAVNAGYAYDYGYYSGLNFGAHSALDMQELLNRTMSPLQAYWNSRNGIKQ
ncbi:MAG: hypothetical protein F6K41_08475 [Symploca sp. SIO3E6]|nr:hypothetical protein [Caldora sp. SIO3E6]